VFLSDDQDRTDVEQVIAGNEDAFEGIVQRWQGPLINLAYRYCYNHAVAEEMAQEAFLKIFRSLGQWRGEGRLSTWMFAVASNVYRSQVRRKKLPKVPLETIGEFAAQRIEQDELDERQRGELVRRAVLGLPAKYRDALTLFYFHEMDVRQAAKSLGVSEGTLKSQLHRGRGLLERKLGAVLKPPQVAKGHNR